MYKVTFSKEALEELLKIRKSMPQAYKKFEKIIGELEQHPYSGTGKPEPLRGLPQIWSRRIDKKNRLRYTVDEDIVTVFVISTLGHYDDK